MKQDGYQIVCEVTKKKRRKKTSGKSILLYGVLISSAVALATGITRLLTMKKAMKIELLSVDKSIRKLNKLINAEKNHSKKVGLEFERLSKLLRRDGLKTRIKNTEKTIKNIIRLRLPKRI